MKTSSLAESESITWRKVRERWCEKNEEAQDNLQGDENSMAAERHI